MDALPDIYGCTAGDKVCSACSRCLLKCFPQLVLWAWKKPEHLESHSFHHGSLGPQLHWKGLYGSSNPSHHFVDGGGGEAGRRLAHSHTVMLQLTVATVILHNQQLQNLSALWRDALLLLMSLQID